MALYSCLCIQLVNSLYLLFGTLLPGAACSFVFVWGSIGGPLLPPPSVPLMGQNTDVIDFFTDCFQSHWSKLDYSSVRTSHKISTSRPLWGKGNYGCFSSLLHHYEKQNGWLCILRWFCGRESENRTGKIAVMRNSTCCVRIHNR